MAEGRGGPLGAGLGCAGGAALGAERSRANPLMDNWEITQLDF